MTEPGAITPQNYTETLRHVFFLSGSVFCGLRHTYSYAVHSSEHVNDIRLSATAAKAPCVIWIGQQVAGIKPGGKIAEVAVCGRKHSLRGDFFLFGKRR